MARSIALTLDKGLIVGWLAGLMWVTPAQANWEQAWENLNPAVQSCTQVVEKRWPRLNWSSRREVNVSRHNRPLTTKQTRVVRTLVSLRVDSRTLPPKTYRIQCGLDIQQRVIAISRRTEKPPRTQ